MPLKRHWIVTVLVATGSAMFVLGLAVSAAFAAEWRVLHVFQALIYVALVVLARQKSAWGFGAGFFVALFWNSLSLIVTTAAHDGIIELMSVLHTGNVQRPDVLLNLFATTGHFLVMLGCAIGMMQLRPRRAEWIRFAAGGVICIAYLLTIVFAFGPPQAIELMRRALHI